MARTPDQIRQGLTDTLNQLRTRRDLSTEGLQRQAAKAYVAARDEMRKARQADGADLQAQQDRLLQKLFGNPNSTDPSSVISFRDAQDRAAQLATAEEAMELLERAKLTGDVLLAQAVAMRAADRAWVGMGNSTWGAVLDAWAAGTPKDDVLTELGTLSRSRASEMLMYALSKPTELTGVNNVDRLANQADDLSPETSRADVFFRGSDLPESG